jgi:hypothetical protein
MSVEPARNNGSEVMLTRQPTHISARRRAEWNRVELIPGPLAESRPDPQGQPQVSDREIARIGANRPAYKAETDRVV